MITGSLVALVTPMHPDGSIHWEQLDTLVDFHLDNGTHGIVAVGTTGESATLDPDEHMRVIGHIIKRVNGRIPVIAGTGGNSTREAIELTEAAHKLGADACLLVVPYYNKPTQEGLYRHFKTIAEAVPVNQILYNVPGRTACDMLNETVERLADIPNIIGIKDATGNIPRGAELIEAVKGRLVVYSGDDATAAGLMLAGGKGNVSVTANVAPGAMAALCEAAIAGDQEETDRLNELLMPLNRKLFLEANPIPVKWALHRMGMIGEGIRLPLTPLSEKFHDEVEEALRASGVL
ncbi:4-hydroxy-tetrahydrodipicolinate synthase [Marinobacter panjinensis]|uniref:4-hydroxy-tetrahydrodipicolinate synthase n=1 Tax=Marinobacter panjinensis TaxID=2576384 RepID=A0A4V6CTX3_9GAMM|nr:4-hydroxy-tetrahydrodipicolinate synthase [Marinobacter panjinensis]MCR8915733.1 4-hydroxy-tetrahydrodipicolinate synthase [Marinobacter panjinensis]TKV67285.1 4-hydroxy-tetrahydrodipicolinate synthase [Marinobacter panjinensis]